ncbi:galactokinase [Folsomia candida]|uniref:galactokinase n=1 Tax=Folsomia candida TaxID=158441 RepID=UPI000B8F2006|nr:galactokinase [Folsomia candida]
MEVVESLPDLVLKCKNAFAKEFGCDPIVGAKAPGRVNIIGEHTDYNDGYVFPMAIPLYSVMVGRYNGTSKIRIATSAEVDNPKRVEFDTPSKENPLTQGEPKWANYVKGVLHHFSHDISGFDAFIISNVPLGGGLSSSASVEVVTCTFLEALTGKSLLLADKALLCQKAEHTFANMPCGIMDQFISCMGKANSALLIDCRSLETKTVTLEGGKSDVDDSVAFLVVNSNVKHQLSGSEYPQRRGDCFKAAELLGVKSLRDANMTALRDKRDELGERVYKRGLHVVSEIERCTKAVKAIEERQLEELGRLMYQSHVSLRDLYEVSCPELDELVDITMITPGVYGSRMTGGGFGGCIVALVKASQAPKIVEEIHKNYSKKATCYVFNGVDGASQIQL